MPSSHVVYGLIALLICLCFGNSLFGDFVFDDTEAIVHNADVNPNLRQNSTGSYFSVFMHDFWGNNITGQSSHKSYRPLTIVAYKYITSLNLKSNELNSAHFHAANLIFYYILCCLLYRTICLFLASELVQCSKAHSKQIAFLTTLLFTVHPIHSEPIASCVGLADILSALFCIAAFYVNIHKVKTLFGSSNLSVLRQIGRLQVLSQESVLLIGVALFFKEPGITYLAIFILLNCVLLRWHNTNRITRVTLTMDIIFLALSALVLLYFRLWIMNFSKPNFSSMDNPASHMSDPFYRYLNYSYVHMLNAFIVICPIWLSFDWSMGCIPLIESIADPRAFIVALSVITCLGILCRWLRSCAQIEARRYLIFATFAVLPFLPSSNLFFPVGFVIAERSLFLPILGYLLIFVISYQRCLTPGSSMRNKLFQYCFYFLFFTYCIRSSTRTKEWMHEKVLFEKDVKVCPGNAKIFYNIAKVAADAGDINKALLNYEKSIFLNENYTNALNNYANILKDRGQVAQAKSLLERACTLDPKFAAALMNLAIAEMSLRNYKQSEMYFHRVIQLRPNHAVSHFNLGNLYLQTANYKGAVQAYSKAVELDGHLVRAWNNLLLLHQKHKQMDLALELASRAIALNDNADSLHFLAGNILGEQDKVEQAEAHYEKAIAIRPSASYHYNLAVLKHRNKLYQQARVHYAAALRLNPEHSEASKQLQMLNKV